MNMLYHYLSVAALNFRKAPIVALANVTVRARAMACATNKAVKPVERLGDVL